MKTTTITRTRGTTLALVIAIAISLGLTGTQGLRAADCNRLTVSAIEGKIDTTARRRADVFYATDVIDLLFSVYLKDSAASQGVLRLDIMTPGGHLYQTLTVPYRSETLTSRGGARPTMQVAGFPKPLPVAEARKSPPGAGKFRVVDVPFPVAGTSIVHNSLYGTWQVVPSLDQQSKPCGQTAEFHLEDSPRR